MQEPQTLAHAARRGVAWTTIGSLGNYGVHFVFNIILARLLSPEDFGICLMPVIFYTLAHICVDGGFSTALVREQHANETDMNTAFWYRLGMGVLAYVILYLCAPLIAGFYHTEVLVRIVRISALSLIIVPMGMIPNVRFMRNLDFRTPAILGIAGALFSGVSGIVLAFNGWGLWSIVWSGLMTDVFSQILIMIMSPWWPRMEFSRQSLRWMFGFGSKMQLSQLLNTIAENLMPIVIGRVYSGHQLGLYMRAQNWARIPSSGLTGIVGKVTMPLFSRLQDERERLASAFRRILQVTAFVIFPLMMGIAAISDPLVRVLLTDKWAGCIPYNQLLCFAMMWYPIHAINLQLLVAKGYSGIFLRLEIVKWLLMLFSLPLLYFGIMTLLWVNALTSPLLLLLNACYTKRLTGVSLSRQCLDLLPILILSAAIYLVVWLCVFMIDGCYIQLAVGIALGAVVYLLGGRLFFAEQQREVWRMIRRR